MASFASSQQKISWILARWHNLVLDIHQVDHSTSILYQYLQDTNIFLGLDLIIRVLHTLGTSPMPRLVKTNPD